MRTFQEIYNISTVRKGGETALEALLDKPKSPAQLAAMPDDRWLACLTKCVFQAGFNWKVVENMWPGFEEAFEGFAPERCAMLHGDDFDRLITDKRIVRHGAKIRAVQNNAVFITELARTHGSAGAAFGAWAPSDFAGLLGFMKKRGARLGGHTGQYFLRFMGVDGFILSHDVVLRLIAESIVDKAPASQKDMRAVQDSFNVWLVESGRSLTEISRVLALSVG